MELDKLDKQLLTVVQRYFPVVERPFDELAKKVGISEQEVISRLKTLKSEKYLRFIGAIINTASLGFNSLLVAFEVDPARIEAVAEIINTHPGVSHNYQRNDRYNLWFTLATPRDIDLNETIKTLCRLTDPKNALLLPAVYTFKIGVILDASDSDGYDVLEREKVVSPPETSSYKLTLKEENIVEALQTSLPLVREPFARLAAKLKTPVPELLLKIEEFLHKAVIRRFGAIPSHRKLGYKCNVMTAWEVPEHKVSEAGGIIASFKAVTHCYHRPVHPDWPYSLYSMIHCRSENDVKSIIQKIIDETAVESYKLLRSEREFKKTRLQYFSDRFQKWQEKFSGNPLS